MRSASRRSASACSAARRSASRRSASSLLGFEALGFQALGFGLLGGEALGFEALGFGLLGGEALGFEALGFQALGFGLLGGERARLRRARLRPARPRCALLPGARLPVARLRPARPRCARLRPARRRGARLRVRSASRRSASRRSASACSAAMRSASACSAAMRSASRRSASRRSLPGARLRGALLRRARLRPARRRCARLRPARLRCARLRPARPTRSASMRSASTRSASMPASALDALGFGLLGGDALGLDSLRLLALGVHALRVGLALEAVLLLALTRVPLVIEGDDLGELAVLTCGRRREGRAGGARSRCRLGRARGGDLPALATLVGVSIAHVLERLGDARDGRRELGVARCCGPLLGRRGLELDDGALDVDEPRVEEAHDDHAGLVDGEAAVVGQVGDGAQTVDLAQQRPVVGSEHDVAGRGRRRRQHRHRVRAADVGDDLGPPGVAVARHGDEVGDLDRRGDVLAGPLAVAEATVDHGPVQEVGDLVAQLLGDEGLDHAAVDEAEVHEQLAESPALQLGALHLQRLGQGLGREGAGGHQADAEQGATTGDGHGVDLAVAEPDGGLLALAVVEREAPGRVLGGQLQEEAVRRRGVATVRHAWSPPARGRPHPTRGADSPIGRNQRRIEPPTATVDRGSGLVGHQHPSRAPRAPAADIASR